MAEDVVDENAVAEGVIAKGVETGAEEEDEG